MLTCDLAEITREAACFAGRPVDPGHVAAKDRVTVELEPSECDDEEDGRSDADAEAKDKTRDCGGGACR